MYNQQTSPKYYGALYLLSLGILLSALLLGCQPASDSAEFDSLEEVKIDSNSTSKTKAVPRLKEQPTLNFNLPSGWKDIENIAGYHSLMKEAEGTSPYYKMETIPNRTFKGKDQDAYDFMDTYYDYQTRPGEEPKEREVLEIELPSGYKIFADVTPSSSELENGYSTLFAFAKDGYVVPMYLNADIQKHLDEMELIISSASFILEEQIN